LLFFNFAKYLLGLPPWQSNTKIVGQFKIAGLNIAVARAKHNEKVNMTAQEWPSVLYQYSVPFFELLISYFMLFYLFDCSFLLCCSFGFLFSLFFPSSYSKLCIFVNLCHDLILCDKF